MLDRDLNNDVWPMLTDGWYLCFGWFYLLTTLPSLILHVIVAAAIYKIPTFNQRISLRLLFSMCIADGMQTLIHCISGFVTIIGTNMPYHLNIFMGLMIETFWEAMMFLQLGLGINRLYIVTRRTITREKEFRYFDWPVVLGWLGSFIYTALYWIGGRRLHYEIEFLGWPTEFANQTTQTELPVYLYNGEMMFMCIGFVLCVLVVIVMAIKRRSKVVSNRVLNMSMELRMLIQVSCIYLMAISNILLWNIFDTAPVEYQALLNFEWILICGLPPYLNIMVSGEIRRSVIALIMPIYQKLFNLAPISVSRLLPCPTSNITISPTTQITRTANTTRTLNIIATVQQANTALKELKQNAPSAIKTNNSDFKNTNNPRKKVMFMSPANSSTKSTTLS